MITMSNSGLAQLPIKHAPLVVGVVTSLSALESVAVSHESRRSYDAVELRLDFLPEGEQRSDGWITLCREMEEKGIPVILTIRLDREGGRWKKADLARKSLFETALGRLSAVDIELSSHLLAALMDMIPDGSTSLIGSYHNFARTPSLMDLRLMVTDARKDGVDIVKIVTTVKTGMDVETLAALLAKKRALPLCVIGMGPKGVDTRFSFPTLGSVLTYGYIDRPTAPGQTSCDELDAGLRGRLPSYRARKEAG